MIVNVAGAFSFACLRINPDVFASIEFPGSFIGGLCQVGEANVR